jgi:hypothetical protein
MTTRWTCQAAEGGCKIAGALCGLGCPYAVVFFLWYSAQPMRETGTQERVDARSSSSCSPCSLHRTPPPGLVVFIGSFDLFVRVYNREARIDNSQLCKGSTSAFWRLLLGPPDSGK